MPPIRNHNGLKEVLTMPMALTLKNIPDEVYSHPDSLNSEACLEATLVPNKVTPSERLARARELRARLGAVKFEVSDIDTYKRQGRP
jgi:hypothetical protein